ncbi:MAG: NfeD family protein [Cyanobacteria bacterium P01_H01_bin.119]
MATDLAVQLFEQPKLGKVERAIAPNQRGRVFFEGTYWPARWHISSEAAIAEAEAWVIVLGRQGITLLVIPNRRPSSRAAALSSAPASI